MPGPKIPDPASTGPVAKRQRLDVDKDQSARPVVHKSKIFAPFRVRARAPIELY